MYEILGLSGTRTLKENRILNTRPRVDTISYNVQSKIGYSLWPTTKQPRGDQLKNVTGRNTLGATIFLFLFRRYSSENVRPKEHKYDCIYQAIIRPIVPCAEIHKVGRTNTTIIFATEVFVTYVWLRKTLRMRIVHTHSNGGSNAEPGEFPEVVGQPGSRARLTGRVSAERYGRSYRSGCWNQSRKYPKDNTVKTAELPGLRNGKIQGCA